MGNLRSLDTSAQVLKYSVSDRSTHCNTHFSRPLLGVSFLTWSCEELALTFFFSPSRGRV